MSRRALTLLGALAVTTVLVLLTAVPAAGQTAPRTPWGDPDLQGVWTGSTLTPIERPERFAGKAVLTKEEAAQWEAQATASRVDRPPQAGDPGTYNQVWFDPGTTVVPNLRTSLITDPSDGRIPYKPEMRQRTKDQAIYRVAGRRDSWVDVDTGERCLTDGVPMVWLGYNPNHQIVQTRNYVVILHEMFRDRRIIPLDGRPHGNIRQWNGDIRGRWEGDTLVVESTNFIDKMNYRWADLWRAPSATLRLVERFKRVDAETIDYQITVEDPTKLTRPFTISVPLTTNQGARGVTQGRLFEYACHEGNYSIVNVLSGARAEDRAADVSAKKH